MNVCACSVHEPTCKVQCCPSAAHGLCGLPCESCPAFGACCGAFTCFRAVLARLGCFVVCRFACCLVVLAPALWLALHETTDCQQGVGRTQAVAAAVVRCVCLCVCLLVCSFAGLLVCWFARLLVYWIGFLIVGLLIACLFGCNSFALNPKP